MLGIGPENTEKTFTKTTRGPVRFLLPVGAGDDVKLTTCLMQSEDDANKLAPEAQRPPIPPRNHGDEGTAS